MMDHAPITILKSRSWRALLCAAALLALSCGDDEGPENQIRPITADIQIQAVSAAPAIFLQRNSAAGDLVLVDVMLRVTSSTSFDSVNLKFQYDPTLIQLSIAGSSPTAFGLCNVLDVGCSVPTPNPWCFGADPDSEGLFTLGVEVVTGSGCSGGSANPPGDVRLLTLAIHAATVGTSAIRIPDNAVEPHSCEILSGGTPIAGIPCFDGSATVTASR